MMKNKEGKIIYIGKAKNLRKRVLSYFNHRGSNEASNWKTSKLVSKIEDVEFLVTDNEIEAFLLESNLIKQYRPLFNIDLKDQQRYTYLKISDVKFQMKKYQDRVWQDGIEMENLWESKAKYSVPMCTEAQNILP